MPRAFSISLKIPFLHGFETRGRAQGVAIRPLALPRGPIPLDPNAFYMYEALAGFDSYWAVSPKKDCKSGNLSFEPMKATHETDA